MHSAVFISYARGASLAHAQALKAALGDLAFLDTSGIDDGDQFQQQLLTNLLNSSVVVIFATGLFVERRFCRLEMRLALAGAASMVLALGEKYSDVLDALLADSQGDHAVARQFQERALEVNTRLLGEEHPSTLMNNLALKLFPMKERDGAIRLLRKCLLGSLKVLGDKHPNTISTAESLKMIEGQ